MAATFEKAKTYVFAEMVVHNPKVGSSIPPPATNTSPTISKTLQLNVQLTVRLLNALRGNDVTEI
ncbi:MAG TPA: hypothetical protein DCK93_04195 [Blastocatellia bacterium]|nr:hypothetical protein [Blastocatellia bacterium]